MNKLTRFKIKIGTGLLLLSLAVSGCSIEIGQALPVIPDATPTARNFSKGYKSIIAAAPVDQIPVTWGDLNLQGSLIYINGGWPIGASSLSVQLLDLKTGEIFTIYQAPENAWIRGVTVSPDGKQLAMSYSSSSSDGMLQLPALYQMPLDGASPPELLFNPSMTDEYFQPIWSPDGKFIYYSVADHQGLSPGQPSNKTSIYRVAYPGGTIKKVADQAFWPNISSDSAQIVYISNDPSSGVNKIMLANADGSDSREVDGGTEMPMTIDAPLFSPDGRSILFSAISPSQASSPTWLEAFLGVTVVSAHSVLSDWWSVPINGGTAIQLTHLRAMNLFASASPDQQYIASYSGYGLFVMKPDGTNQKMLNNNLGRIPSTVNWVP